MPGPRLRLAITTPGSIADTIAACALAACAAAGHGLTVGAHAEAYAAQHGTCPSTYRAQFFSLVRRGVLVRCDGRASRTRYAHRDNHGMLTATPASGEGVTSALLGELDDDALKVMAALEHAARAAGSDVPTAAVRRALDELGLELASRDPNAVRVRLRTLCRARQRGVEMWMEPRAHCVSAVTSRGRTVCLWGTGPAKEPWRAGAVLAPALSAAETARELVQHVQTLLGRPVFHRELRWWLEANAATELAAQVREVTPAGGRTLTALLVDTARHDAKASGPVGLCRIDLEFSCWGGAAPRYWVGDIPPVALLGAEVEDLATGLRLADELTALETLARRARAARIRAVDRLIEVRRGALAWYLHDALPQSHETLAASTEALLKSFAQCRIWATAGAKTGDAAYARQLDIAERERHVRALPLCALATPTDGCRTVVGEWSAVPLTALEPFLVAAEKELGIPRHVARVACLKGVRRIPFTMGSRSRFGSHADRQDVAYDRADALLRLYRMAPASRTHALLDLGAELLGPVLRDAKVLRDVADAKDATPGLRRAAMIALALLGEEPAIDYLKVGRIADPLEGRAVLLALTLAGGRRPWLRFDDRGLDLAARRLASGRLLTALG